MDILPFVNDKEAMDTQPTLLQIVSSEMLNSTNPYTSKETIVLRNLKRLTEQTFNLSWSATMDTVRQGILLMDFNLHEILFQIMRNNHQIIDESTVERILARDYIKLSDMTNLAKTLTTKGLFTVSAKLFAVDGFQGTDDLRKYVNNFNWTNEEWKQRHVKAVRTLYDVVTNEPISKVLTSIFVRFDAEEKGEDIEPMNEEMNDVYEIYMEIVGKENVARIAQWRMDEWKKHIAAETEAAKRKKATVGEKTTKKQKTKVESNGNVETISGEPSGMQTVNNYSEDEEKNDEAIEASCPKKQKMSFNINE